jgi:cyclopropane fatty-acyl-phospholipid synthase-like methyltransferase
MKHDSEGFPDRAEILRIARLKNKTLLDIGTGSFSIIAARDFNCRVTNIDNSAEALGRRVPASRYSANMKQHPILSKGNIFCRTD